MELDAFRWQEIEASCEHLVDLLQVPGDLVDDAVYELAVDRDGHIAWAGWTLYCERCSVQP